MPHRRVRDGYARHVGRGEREASSALRTDDARASLVGVQVRQEVRRAHLLSTSDLTHRRIGEEMGSKQTFPHVSSPQVFTFALANRSEEVVKLTNSSLSTDPIQILCEHSNVFSGS